MYTVSLTINVRDITTLMLVRMSQCLRRAAAVYSVETSTMKTGSDGSLATLQQVTRPHGVISLKDAFDESSAFSAILCGVYRDLSRCLVLESYQNFLTDNECYSYTRFSSSCCLFVRLSFSSFLCVTSTDLQTSRTFFVRKILKFVFTYSESLQFTGVLISP
jgi:hypothetical protein